MPTKPTKELGQSGTYIYEGQIVDTEYNRDLIGPKALQNYERMRKGDATVRALLLSLKLPILSAKLRVDPASESAEDKEIAEWVDNQLKNMTRPFWDVMREGLAALDFGHYLFEIVYQIGPDGRIGLKKLAPRLPATIYAWQTKEGTDGITQMLANGESISIPMEKLVVLINEKEGDNWQGTSILRSAYKNWKMKEALEKIDAIAHERQGLGVPFAKPLNTPSQSDKDNSIQRMRDLRANEEDGLYIPPGWEYGFMDMKANTTRDPMKSIEYHRFEIMLSILASFLLLGSTDSGSRALSTDLSEFFEMAIKYVAEQQLATYNEYLVKRVVDLNFTVKEYPKLSLDGLGSFDYAKVTESLTKMMSAKVLTPTLDVEQSLRKAMGLQEAPEDSFYPDPTEEPEPPIVDPTKSDNNASVDPTKSNKDSKQVKASQEAFLEHYVKSEAEAIRLSLGQVKGDDAA